MIPRGGRAGDHDDDACSALLLGKEFACTSATLPSGSDSFSRLNLFSVPPSRADHDESVRERVSQRQMEVHLNSHLIPERVREPCVFL